MRWLLQLGGRWLTSQVWRGVRAGQRDQTTAKAGSQEQGASGSLGGAATSKAIRQHCALGVVCSSRRLFDGFSEVLSRKRTIEASQFRLLSGLLQGTPVVVVLPHDTNGGLTRSIAALVDGHHPQFVVSVGEGMSGGDAVPEGEVVVAIQLVGPDGERLKLEGATPHAEWVHRGRVDVGPGLPGVPLAIDSWSWENAVACRSVGVPLVAVTAITKPCAERESPGAKLLRPSATLARRTGTFAGLVWREPKELKRAWQLQTAAWQACDRAVKLVSYMAKASTPT